MPDGEQERRVDVVDVVGYVGGGSGPLLDQRLAPEQGAMAAI